METLNNKMIEWRRHFHAHPEVSFQEFETANYIYEKLEAMNVYRLERLTPTSVIATLKGKEPGLTIALRADIDALPIFEEADVEFRSKVDGVMHACGHDTHATMLLGTAEILSTMQDQIKGTVKLIFQHAEELPPGGASELVAKGVMDDVDLVFGQHIFPMMPTGSITLYDGIMTAASDIFEIKLKGKGAHGSMPHLALDPIMSGAKIVSSVNALVSQRVNAFDHATISFGSFTAGNAPNIIPDSATLSGSVRTLNAEVRTQIEADIKAIVEHTSAMDHLEAEVIYTHGYAPIVNDEKAMHYVKAAALDVVGEAHIAQGQTMMVSEDFSAYLSKAPGAFFALGGGEAVDGYGYINHHPKFKVDEDAMMIGVRMFVSLIEQLLVK